MPGGKKKQEVVESETESDFDEEGEEEETEEEEFDLVEAMNDMTLAERRKVYALKGIQEEYNELMIQYRLELAALELKQHKAREADFARRARIVSGEEEVKAEEVEQGKKDVSSGKIEEIPSSDDEDEKKTSKRKGVKVVAPTDTKKGDNGVPDFWLTALRHNEVIAGQVTEKDAEILSFCTNISQEFLEDKPELGFVLTFHFAENPFFSQKTLTKTCHWNQERKGDEEQIESLEGTKIAWTTPEKNPGVTIKEKKQRHKSGKGVRIVKKEEKTDSFFHFFSPIQLDDEGAPVGDFTEDEEGMLEEMISQDEDITLCIQSTIIPRACYYFTGEPMAKHAEALRAAFGMGDMDDEDEEEDDDYEDEDEESEEEEPAPKKGGAKGGRGGGRGAAPKGGRGGGAHADPNADCKQQ